MLGGKKIPQIFIYFQKNEKPPSIYRTAICTENQIWKDFRKDPPHLLLMYIFETKFKAQLLQLSMFPNLASDMLSTSYPSKN